MANIEISKDANSIYLVSLMNVGDVINHLWVLPNSYTAIVAEGRVDIGESDSRSSIGLYRVPSNEQLLMTAVEKSVVVIPILISDTWSLLLGPAIRRQIRESTSRFVPYEFETDDYASSERLVYGARTRINFTRDDFESEIISRLAAGV